MVEERCHRLDFIEWRIIVGSFDPLEMLQSDLRWNSVTICWSFMTRRLVSRNDIESEACRMLLPPFRWLSLDIDLGK